MAAASIEAVFEFSGKRGKDVGGHGGHFVIRFLVVNRESVERCLKNFFSVGGNVEAFVE